MGKKIGSLFWEIGADSSKFAKGLQDSKSKLGNFKSKLNETVQSVTGFNLSQIGAAAAVGAVVKGITSAIRETMAYADTVRELSRVNGASAEETSRVIQMTDDLGLSLEELNTASTMAARQGITLTTDSLAKMSAEFLAMESPAERNAYALENFGRSGLNMIKVLEAGPDKLREMSAAVSSNLILTDAQVRKARELEIAQDNLNDTWQGVKTVVATSLLPALVSVTEELFDQLTYVDKINAAFGTQQGELFTTARSYAKYTDGVIEAAFETKKYTHEGLSNAVYFLRKQTGANEENRLSLRQLNGMTNEQIIALAKQEGYLQDIILSMGGYSEQTFEAAGQMDYADRMAQGLGDTLNGTTTPAIQDGAEALLSAEDAAKRANDAMRNLVNDALGPLTSEMLNQQIMSTLTGDALLEYARKTGQLDPVAYDTLHALQSLTAEFDLNKDGVVDGTEATADYWKELYNLDATAGDIETAMAQLYEDFDKNKDGAINANEETAEYRAELARINGMRAQTYLDRYETTHVSTVYGNESAHGNNWQYTSNNNDTTVQAEATGGPVMAGMPYMVGENGPEPFVPSQAGSVTSNNDFMGMLKQIANNTIDYGKMGRVFRDALQGMG